MKGFHFSHIPCLSLSFYYLFCGIVRLLWDPDRLLMLLVNVCWLQLANEKRGMISRSRMHLFLWAIWFT